MLLILLLTLPVNCSVEKKEHIVFSASPWLSGERKMLAMLQECVRKPMAIDLSVTLQFLCVVKQCWCSSCGVSSLGSG